MPNTKPGAEQNYTGGADRLLNREPPAGYVAEWTAHVAAVKQVAAQEALSAVIFRLGDEFLALSSELVREVAEHCPFHTLPHRRNGVLKGLANVRGELLLCVAFDSLLGVTSAAQNSTAESQTVCETLLVCDRAGQRIAVAVAEVVAIQRYDPKELTEVPATLAKKTSKFVVGLLRWRERTVGCLDNTALFNALRKYLS